MEPTYGCSCRVKRQTSSQTDWGTAWGNCPMAQSTNRNKALAADKAQADYLDISVMVSPKCQPICVRGTPYNARVSKNSPTEIVGNGAISATHPHP